MLGDPGFFYYTSVRIVDTETCATLDGDPVGVQPKSEGFFLPLLSYQGLSIYRRHVVTHPPTTNTT